MRLEYASYEKARRDFKWRERWEVFDKGKEHLNIAYECVDRHPSGKTAIRLQHEDGTRDTYSLRELSSLSSQFANMLEKRGIGSGDRVAMLLWPSLEFYVSFFGALKRGAVAVPCYPLLGSEAVEYRLRESGARIVIVNEKKIDLVPKWFRDHVIPAEQLCELIQDQERHYSTDTAAESPAVLQFSSGTSGFPKPVLYTHGAASVTAVYVKFWLGLQETDRYMCPSSPAWGHGIWYGTVGPLIFGNGIGSYAGRFDPLLFLEALQEFEITVVSAIPRVYQMIMNCGRLDSYRLQLRRLTYTGSPMPRDVSVYFHSKLGLAPASVYGNTEAGPVVVDYAFKDWKPKLGSAGKPMFGVKLGVIAEDGTELPPNRVGAIAVWRRGEWSALGDEGYLDEEGYVWPIGRSDDVIKSSGYRIGPYEIENMLEKHPAVARAAVVGSPDKNYGEIVKAFIVLRSHYGPSDELKLELQEFVKTRLGRHEYPKEIDFVETLPETPDGKVKRKDLKKSERERKTSVGR